MYSSKEHTMKINTGKNVKETNQNNTNAMIAKRMEK